MLDFSDAPYRFYSAKPNQLIMWMSRWINRKFFLPHPDNKVTSVEVSGAIEAAQKLKAQGRRILFIPNHSTHSDPYVMKEVQRQLGIPSCFMAAYDIFVAKGKMRAWVMQKVGSFSVDREGSDSQAMKAALDVIKAGKYALTIFPEGNVYLTNDRVTPFLEGSAFLALRAQKELGEEDPIYAIPVSMKFTHVTDVRPDLIAQLGELAVSAGTELDTEASPLSELVRIGGLHMNEALRDRGYLKAGEKIGENPDELHDEMEAVAATIIGELERKIDVPPRPGDDVITRFRRVRSKIHQIRIDPDNVTKHRAAATWADEAILALRILGHSTPYVAEKPTLDRFSETVLKLLQDVYSRHYEAWASEKYWSESVSQFLWLSALPQNPAGFASLPATSPPSWRRRCRPEST